MRGAGDGDLPFGRWLKRRRTALDLTQAMLAAQVGCAAETLHKIESGRLRPSRQVAARLAACLQVPEAERDAVVQAARARPATPPAPRPPLVLPQRARLAAPLNPLIGREAELAALGELRATPERHRSIRAAFEHSWNLLSGEERQVFARLSVFRGGFDEHAAAHVAQASPALLTALLDKSLLRWDGVARYDVHELLRQYAGEKLVEAGEADEISNQHLAYYYRLAEQGGQELYGPKQTAWSERLDRELGNLRAALAWSVEHDIEAGLRFAGALDRYWNMYRPRQEGIGWLEQLLRHPDEAIPNVTRARALLALGRLNYHDLPDAARALAEEGLALYQALEDEAGVVRALLLLGGVVDYQEGRGAGVPIVSPSLALARACGDARGIAEALEWLAGLVYQHNHDYEQARASYEEALVLFRKLGDVADLPRLLTHMAEVAAWSGNFARAHQWLDEAQALSAEQRVIGDAFDLCWTLGLVALYEGQYAQAQEAFEQRLALVQASGGGVDPWTLAGLGYAAVGQGELARAAALFTEAVQLSVTDRRRSVWCMRWRALRA